MSTLTSSTETYRAAHVAGRPTPSARYVCRPDTARPQADLGCLRIRRTRQMGRVASSAVGNSNSGISLIWTPHICPRNYLFPWTDPQAPLPASSLDPSNLPCQTASRFDPPFFHNALDRQRVRQTDREHHKQTDS